MIKPFLMALGLLSVLPVNVNWENSDEFRRNQAYSTLFYPLVGVMLALIIGGVYFLLPASLPFLLQASILLCVWVMLTGGLHLDGVADVVDGVYAGHKDPERILTIMKQPDVGAMGAVAIGLVLIQKLALLEALLRSGSLSLVLLFSTLAIPRLLVSVYMSITSYVRKEGIVSNVAFEYIAYWPWLIVGVVGVSGLVLLPLIYISLIAVSVAVYLYFWRRYWNKLIGGFTGDCLGALIETSEILLLYIWVFLTL